MAVSHVAFRWEAISRGMSKHTSIPPKVSVLMAVHDAERTVRRAVESLQNQTMGSFELIAVDGGSRDGSARILDAIADREVRLSVVRAGECGRQAALNLALERAHGTYVVVVDADGWADPCMLQRLVDAAEKDDLELVVGAFSLCVGVEDDRQFEVDMDAPDRTFATQEEFRTAAWRLFSTGQMLPASGKLFSRRRLAELGLGFDDDSGTDHSLVLSYLRDVERVGVMGVICYHVARTIPRAARVETGLRAYARFEEEHSALLDLYRHWGLEGDVASMETLQSRYVEELAACVEEVCGNGIGVPDAGSRRLVADMIGTDRARVAASVARPRGATARSMLAHIRSGNVGLTCVQGRLGTLLRRADVAQVLPDAFV